MKKILYALTAVVMICSFASCTIETSKVTVTVTDMDGNPVSDRAVYYTDLATAILEVALPAPDAPLKDNSDDEWEYGETNAQGVVTFSFDLAFKSLNYYFMVLDEGSNQWTTQTIKLKRGENAEITFQVNK